MYCLNSSWYLLCGKVRMLGVNDLRLSLLYDKVTEVLPTDLQPYRHTEGSGPEWQRIREECSINGSAMRAVVTRRGKKRYLSQKLGKEKRVITSREEQLFAYGHAMESVARRYFTERTGFFVVETGPWLVPGTKWGGSPDGLLMTDPPSILEIKTKTPMAKLDGEHWRINPNHVLQCYLYMMATGVRYTFIWYYHASKKTTLYFLPLDEEVRDRLTEFCQYFEDCSTLEDVGKHTCDVAIPIGRIQGNGDIPLNDIIRSYENGEGVIMRMAVKLTS